MLGSLAVDAPIDLSSIEPERIIAALVVVLVAWLGSRYTRRATAKCADPAPGISDQIRKMTARTAGYLVLFLGFGTAPADSPAITSPESQLLW